MGLLWMLLCRRNFARMCYFCPVNKDMNRLAMTVVVVFTDLAIEDR